MKLNKRGHSPLLDPSWKDCTCPKCGSKASRETDTLDTFVDSSWYYIRFLDPSNKVTYCEKSKSNNLPVDVYIGGIEHACMHLLYARFISKFLNNIGIIKTPNGEPFQKLLNQGMVKSKTFKCKSSGKYVPQSSVTDESSMIITFEKMSKSKFNGVDPSEIIKQHGIDSTRLFMLFKSHPSDDLAWETTGIIGIKRFLDKVTNLAQSVVKSDPDHHALSVFNSSVKFIDTSMDKFAFNVVIAELMKITSLLQNHPHFKLVCDLVVMIYPFAPDFATRTWLMLSDSDIISQKWPIVNDSTVLNKKLIASVIIDGKKRGTVEYPNDFKDKEIANLIYGDCNFKSYLQGEKKVAFYQSNKKMKIVSFT